MNDIASLSIEAPNYININVSLYQKILRSAEYYSAIHKK